MMTFTQSNSPFVKSPSWLLQQVYFYLFFYFFIFLFICFFILFYLFIYLFIFFYYPNQNDFQNQMEPAMLFEIVILIANVMFSLFLQLTFNAS